VLLFPNALGRLIESVRDIILSTIYFIQKILGINNTVIPTINELPKIPFFTVPGTPGTPSGGELPTVPIPTDWESFKIRWMAYWNLFGSSENILSYIILLLKILFRVLTTILIVIPFFVLLWVLLKRYLKHKNNNYNENSAQLKVFKRITAVTYRPLKLCIINLCGFIKERKIYWITWLSIWAYSFNLFTIIIEFTAFYFYLILSLDFILIYRQVYKLFIDLMPIVEFIPAPVWIIIGLCTICYIRKRMAYKNLRRMEEANREFINNQPIVIMVCGTMGTGKTKTITDIALSQEVLLREKALEKIRENDMKFPNFPWINFENEIKNAIANHLIYNLTTARRFTDMWQKWFETIKADTASLKSWKRHCKKLPFRYNNILFDYDYELYGIDYDDKLKISSIWDVLKSYAQLYFIYVIQSAIISNYSIRTDNVFKDEGNFPLWDTDFFGRDSKDIDNISRHAHIIDFDALRLGRKLIEDNPNKDFFEFGVVMITEVGKERGNALSNGGKEKSSEEANQCNDLFNTGLKMIRHPSTIDGFPFVKVITDEQRPNSWGADARDLCEIIHIREVSDDKLAMPFFAIEELIFTFIYSKFEDIYSTYRHNRGDNTLLIYLLKGITSKVHNYYKRIYNFFGYQESHIQAERGTMDGSLENSTYYLSFKKVHSKRYATDCYGEFYAQKVSRSNVGLSDIPEYQTERATFPELENQDSYFIKDLTKIRDNKDVFKKQIIKDTKKDVNLNETSDNRNI
jgi:hypothetical protein